MRKAQGRSRDLSLLKKELKSDGLLGGVGDEGGFAPNLPANEEGLKYMVRAIEGAGYSTEEMGIALDVAATEFYQDGKYHMDSKAISSEELANIYSGWLDDYPILSIEDGFAEDDWRGWTDFTKAEGNRVQIVGDDLFVTQAERLAQGIEMLNAMLVKVNQVGTVTETLESMDLASSNGFNNVISHRSGETEDVTIADLAVGTRAGQIKPSASKVRPSCQIQSVTQDRRRCQRISFTILIGVIINLVRLFSSTIKLSLVAVSINFSSGNPRLRMYLAIVCNEFSKSFRSPTHSNSVLNIPPSCNGSKACQTGQPLPSSSLICLNHG